MNTIVNQNITVSVLINIQHLKTSIKEILSKFYRVTVSENVGQSDVIIANLFDIDQGRIVNCLKQIKEMQSANSYTLKYVFIVDDVDDIPNLLEPHQNMQPYAKQLIGIPEFGSIDKAVLLAEIIYGSDDNDNDKIINILNMQDPSFVDSLEAGIRCVSRTIAPSTTQLTNSDMSVNFKADYYSTFVNYYNSIDRAFQDTLKAANDIYNKANGIVGRSNAHSTNLELFSAPVPFPFYEVISTWSMVKEILEGNKENNGKNKEKGGEASEISFLLIDNRLDKIVHNDNQPGPLCRILEKYDLNHFELHNLDNTVYKKEKGGDGWKFFPENNKSSRAGERFNEFDYKRFKNRDNLSYDELKREIDFIQSVRKEYTSEIKTYFEYVYYKVKRAHFVLLDFFLNTENTYHAFEFIKDISNYKIEKEDYAPVWYFITSAVYDSVVRYSTSGLLAEHYEYAIINSGDDPHNEKRQIIFLYKLLLFVNGRIKKVTRYRKSIFNKILSEEGKCEIPETHNTEIHEAHNTMCRSDDCLSRLQRFIGQYLIDYDTFSSIFHEQVQHDYYKEILQLVADTINKYLLLPEADWMVVQSQIDFIDNKMRLMKNGTDKSKKYFTCDYIRNELKKRSERY